MQAWHFTEMPYPHLPPLDTLKNDPRLASRTGCSIRRSAPISITAISTST